MTTLSLKLNRTPVVELDAHTESLAAAAQAALTARDGELPPEFEVTEQRYSIHVCIRTPSYRKSGGRVTGFEGSEEAQWRTEAAVVLSEAGLVEYHPRRNLVQKYLAVHLHPDDISGTMTLSEMESLVTAIKSTATSFTVEAVDIYGVVESLSYSEMQKRVQYHAEAIKAACLEHLATANTRTFKNAHVTRYTQGLPGLSLVEECTLGLSLLVVRLMTSMIEEGLLIRHPTDYGYLRAANKTERAALLRSRSKREQASAPAGSANED